MAVAAAAGKISFGQTDEMLMALNEDVSEGFSWLNSATWTTSFWTRYSCTKQMSKNTNFLSITF